MQNPALVFNPCPGERSPAVTFQVAHLRLTGELGASACRAAQHFGLKNHKFVEACIKFALDHTEGLSNG